MQSLLDLLFVQNLYGCTADISYPFSKNFENGVTLGGRDKMTYLKSAGTFLTRTLIFEVEQGLPKRYCSIYLAIYFQIKNKSNSGHLRYSR